jgi:predicted metal-dependent phosphoesterase TrpH
MSITIEPLVVPIDRRVSVLVRGLEAQTAYTVRVRARRQEGPGSEDVLAADGQGRLSLERAYPERGEYWLDVLHGEQRLARLSFYTLPPELYRRRPLRCDFHIHTHYSDGQSTPAEMAVRGRELGLDVAVITDHNYYPASLEAGAEVARLGLNLITGPGEEVSGPNWHILSIGADAAIYELGQQSGAFLNEAEWRYDALCWAIRATQEHGGRAYLAHPYWSVDRGFHLPSPWVDRVLEEGFLDGVELLGDVVHENNFRSLARYLDYRAAGGQIPIVGNSDTHRLEHTYGSYWTLVWAEAPTLESVLAAIAEGWSVACTTAGREAAGESRAARMAAYGPFELVDLAYWLEERFFPAHDVLCAEEAGLAYRALREERLPEGALEACRARMEGLYRACWGRS